MNILKMPNGTIIKNKRSGQKYQLSSWVNEDARKIISVSHPGAEDCITRFSQDDYEVADAERADGNNKHECKDPAEMPLYDDYIYSGLVDD